MENKNRDRLPFAPLEAFDRLMAGISPWLELGPDNTEEGQLRERFINLAITGYRNAVDPTSNDKMQFVGGQPLVDTAYMAQSLIRAPTQLWGRLDTFTKEKIILIFINSRSFVPHKSNWLLFSATVEAALLKFHHNDTQTSINRIHSFITEFNTWYLGDGMYGDGPSLSIDYYNSYVIHPMLLEVTKICSEMGDTSNGRYYHVFLKRARRYAEILERLISPEGTFPVVGRSNSLRFAPLHLLGFMALHHQLPRS